MLARSTKTLLNRFWATRVGEFVQFRLHPTRPKALMSKLTKTVKKRFDIEGFPMGPGKITIKQVAYVTGKPLWSTSYSKFLRHTGIKVPVDGVMRVPRETYEGYKSKFGW